MVFSAKSHFTSILVATFGPFYIKQASFGASMIVSGDTGADNSDENALNDLKWEVGSHFFKKATPVEKPMTAWITYTTRC